ncbi:hypothetical protein P0W64_08495 [Tsukamurella sp. 8F]|uniref:hypothetical protein n=1 Tax=unclassified Tsukamurella TaxID=2633480 RepID=UPI0023B9A214|nr:MULTISPECIES: hypothetical protein [unclassified Tsukamurella]MDF0530542.1 hypothetical protein [Tsukamurella sp. 8J]MDF0586808.1 hypothetical protein [Tsukamurella sp. 8F]
MDPYLPNHPQEPVLVTIGDIHVTATQVITPVGAFPLEGSRWVAVDQVGVERRIPSWAVIATVVGFFFVACVSLLFLLVKEQRTVVYSTQVTVVGPQGQTYTTTVPVGSPAAAADIAGRLSYVRALGSA